MALTDEGNSGIPATMLVGPANFAGAGQPYPVYMGGGQGGGNSGGWDQGNGWWIILLFILLASGNWGGNNSGNGGGFGSTPIVVNDGGGSSVQRGFDQAAVMSGINGVQNGIYGLSTQLCNCCSDIQGSLCNGFAGVNATVNSVAANAETAANARAMSNMQQLYGLSTQFADCCCENRLGIADLRYTIATENCADRAAISDGIRDVIVNQTANTQRILDQLCADKIDAKNEKIADLERQLTMANLNASQVAQTARLERGQNAEVDALYQRLRDCPVPSMPVYGMQPIFTCQSNNCGCGCNNGCGCGGNNF